MPPQPADAHTPMMASQVPPPGPAVACLATAVRSPSSFAAARTANQSYGKLEVLVSATATANLYREYPALRRHLDQRGLLALLLPGPTAPVG
jgi:hypothetical protein